MCTYGWSYYSQSLKIILPVITQNNDTPSFIDIGLEVSLAKYCFVKKPILKLDPT
jgi:hypothetical protein